MKTICSPPDEEMIEDEKVPQLDSEGLNRSSGLVSNPTLLFSYSVSQAGKGSRPPGIFTSDSNIVHKYEHDHGEISRTSVFSTSVGWVDDSSFVSGGSRGLT